MDAALAERLDQMEAEYRDLMAQLGSQEVASDPDRYTQLAKKAADLEDAVRAYREYREVAGEASEARELLEETSGGDERDYYRTVHQEAAERCEKLESRLLRLLVPRDPRDERSVLVEIRSGAGGDEAALFAGDLVRMLQRYAERHGWKTEILDASYADVGGVREAVLEVEGKGAFSRLKHESGVHRVQRVPETESSGRIHTSTATIAVLAEVDEVEVEVSPDELRVDYYRSSGPGGQHVNTTDSAVRLTHEPSGIVVACQSERSQRQNRERAMKILMAKLNERAEAEAAAEVAEERRSQVGTGERAEKIRTYNFPQNRVTDHRVNVTVHDVERVLDGELDEFIDDLLRHEEDALVRNT